ncbi:MULTISPECIES: cell wall-active antibiotics response protein LiaF [Paenibacillus]|jgi:lia operon protein LiaF|uniref:Lia operon protein LiaF n=1 Tax=Paenibacillus barengoltzii J12 TaxID=935846 RepID=A0ABY1M1J9_9BACL|nr:MULTISPECIES: cell wall-active antibiotics response protein LiaF [Paenibacillus]MEC2343581.1 cell wall-active antibiotics response protein LiaF [Paenibacillus barengoltzii]SMF48995.1 lia operon protein LiaF [Paenibacillus barengoltzii]SMF54974.1 lia operon protein LiaF [Paenibacillus barengoltzii J12]
MDTRKRFLAIGLIGFGLLLIFGKWLSFFTIVALFLLGFGIYKIRQGEQVKTGYILMAIGGGLILLDHFMLILAILMISLGYYYAKVRKTQPQGNYVQKQNITSSVRWDRDPWNLRNTSMWHVLGELDIDLSLAMMEGGHNVLMFQGIVGDVDLVIPEDYGVEIEAFVLFGQIDFSHDKETGMLNRLYWKSPNYETRDQKVKIIISYLVGDVDIRLL